MDNKKIMIGIIATLIISIIGLGIAFAAFSRNLVIGGNASVVASTWDIVFEGITNTNTIDDPVLTGSANEVVHPILGNNGTEIGNYSVTLTAPGDSVTYNFKVHNKGDYAGSVSSIVINSGVNLTTDTSKQSSEINTLTVMDYKLYYTDTNELVGQSAKDCLEPGESENVTLKIIFSSTDATNTNILPSSDLLLDNLGVTVNYVQVSNNSCLIEGIGETVSNKAFQNFDGAYYIFEEKSFIGTGMNNLIISEAIDNVSQYSTAYGTDNGSGSNPRYTFAEQPAVVAAETYCTGCRLMTKDEAVAWGCPTSSGIEVEKCKGYYSDSTRNWWLADAYSTMRAWYVYGSTGRIYNSGTVTGVLGVRPVTSVSNGATITGSGTQASPYVITVNN